MALSIDVNELENFELSFRDELQSEIFYNSLHKLSNLRGYIDNCSSLGNLPFSTSVKRICAKVLEYLDTIYSKSYKQGDQYDVCLLLNYWVYSSLFNLLKIKGERFVYQAYAQLQPIWNGFVDDKIKKPEHQKCRPISDLVLYNDWRERKKLYEYYVDYSSISKTLVGYKQWCNDFYKYVKSKKPLYKHFEKRCPSKDTKRCPKFYEQCLQYDPEIVLPHRDCPEEIMKEGAAAALTVPKLRNGLPDSELNSEETDGPMMPDDAPKFSGKPKTVENVGNILLGVVATTMTSGALYRFTPLGGMIRNGFGRKNNMRNFNGGDFRLYDSASEPFNPYPGEEHYIGYHPA